MKEQEPGAKARDAATLLGMTLMSVGVSSRFGIDVGLIVVGAVLVVGIVAGRLANGRRPPNRREKR